MLPPMTGAATSQSTVGNDQTQSSAVSSSQTLNVVDTSDSTSGVTTSTANNLVTGSASGGLNVVSSQSLQADTTASTTLNVTTNAGASTTLNTAATGNTSDMTGVTGAAALTGTFAQTAGPVNVNATSQMNAGGVPNGSTQTGALSTGTQAFANSAGFTNQDSALNVSTTQTSTATTDAEDGVVLQWSPGTAAVSASAVSNNLTGAGTGAASQTINAVQTMSGGITQAGEYADFGNVQTAQSSASAVANNISTTNENGGLSLTDTQNNSAYVQAQSQVTAYDYGSAQASAYGVGNSVLAGDYGSPTTLDNTQTNSGDGVSASASFSSTGNIGYDAGASATAMGNAATGYACSSCGGVINVANSQTNSAGVEAASSLSVAPNRSVSGVATAVGNSATFYVSKPGG
ncbi:MAG: holdfast anchor protein HfaD [Caulobacteraceae bacterium]|nr:holdfast anchor protein HfaD [Caulobacteraceae bacterium]